MASMQPILLRNTSLNSENYGEGQKLIWRWRHTYCRE